MVSCTIRKFFICCLRNLLFSILHFSTLLKNMQIYQLRFCTKINSKLNTAKSKETKKLQCKLPKKSIIIIVFICSMLRKMMESSGKNLWIGMTDRDTEGTWKYLNGDIVRAHENQGEELLYYFKV